MTVTAVLVMIGTIYAVSCAVCGLLGALIDGGEGFAGGIAVGFSIASVILTGIVVVLLIVFLTGGIV